MSITLALRVWDKKAQDFKANLYYTVNSESVTIKKVMFQRQKQTTTTRKGIKIVSISLCTKEIKLPQNVNACVPVSNEAKLWT